MITENVKFQMQALHLYAFVVVLFSSIAPTGEGIQPNAYIMYT